MRFLPPTIEHPSELKGSEFHQEDFNESIRCVSDDMAYVDLR